MVLGTDDVVAGGAFLQHIQVHELACVGLHVGGAPGAATTMSVSTESSPRYFRGKKLTNISIVFYISYWFAEVQMRIKVNDILEAFVLSTELRALLNSFDASITTTYYCFHFPD